MICKYCNNVVDDDAVMCPHCNSPLVDFAAAAAEAESEYTGEFETDYELPQVSYEHQFETAYSYDEPEEEEDVFAQEESRAKSRKKLGVKLPDVPFSTLLSLACAIFSLVCLFMVSNMKADIDSQLRSISSSVSSLNGSFAAVEGRLSSMESTIANVQSDAYNQLASQNITITKDITSLVGPVTMGKYNQMFIVKAKGNLSLNTSFDWQKYNEATNGWVSIVFTGTATSNDEYGLRLENKMEAGEYVSILWANGITPSGAGTYRCVISDSTGVKKTSSEAIVQVA